MLQALQDEDGDLVLDEVAATAAAMPTITPTNMTTTLPSAEQQLVFIGSPPPNSGMTDQVVGSLQYAVSGEFEASLDDIIAEDEPQSTSESR